VASNKNECVFANSALTVYVPGTACTNIKSHLSAVKDFLVYVTEDLMEGVKIPVNLHSTATPNLVKFPIPLDLLNNVWRGYYPDRDAVCQLLPPRYL
jgi:hypothetical protein